jgi:5'-nucleotidase
MTAHIWYNNGTPSASVQVALDYVFLMVANIINPDLIMSDLNFGWNLGLFLYTLSGTIGGTYTAVERGIPDVAFSTRYGVQTPYYCVNANTNAGLQDPATIAGELAANLAQQLIVNAKALFFSLSDTASMLVSHTSPNRPSTPGGTTFHPDRMTCGANVDQAV